MNNKMKLAGLILGAALTTSSAFAANGSCGAGKCGAAMMKDSKQACDLKGKDHKCDCKDKEKCKCESKEKCTCNMKKEMKGSCGAGKCGAEMKNDANNEMKDKSTIK